MGKINTLVVLDSGFVPGKRGRQALDAARDWITSKGGFEGSLSLSGPLGNGWDPGWLPFGGGVVHVAGGPASSRFHEVASLFQRIRPTLMSTTGIKPFGTPSIG